MMLACGFLGCLGQAFMRSPSPSSVGAGEQSSQNHHRHHHADRNHGRGGRGVSHTGMAATTPHAAAANGSMVPATEVDRRLTPSGPLSLATAASTQEVTSLEGDPLGGGGGAAAAAAAVAASTQLATVHKLDRGGPSRRTPLHIAAERGQLHVLSAIIENLCCSATAALLAEDTAPGMPSPSSSVFAGGGLGGDSAGNADASQDGMTDGGAARLGLDRSVDAPMESSRTAEGAPQGSRHHLHQQRHAGAGPYRSSGGQQLQLQRGSLGLVEEFPRPGAGGAPLAPERYIQLHLNMQDGEGTTALSLACRFGHVDCCRLLLANGSARTLSDARGNTPLHYAALRGHLGVLFMLLDEFVEPGQEEQLNGYVDARNHAGCTPLHYAVWGRQSGSVQVLLQHGADVLPRNSRPAQELTPPVMVVGSTPLHLAAARGHGEVCRIILKTFAERVLEPLQLGEEDPQPPTLASLDPRVQVNANGHMPYQVAQRLGFYPLAMLLRPSIPILRLFSDEERAVRFYGPAPLRAIAAEALNKKLLSEIDNIASAAGAAPLLPPAAVRSSAAGAVRQQPAAAAAASTTGGGGGADAGEPLAGARWPVSGPATLERLAAAAAIDAEEEVHGGRAAAGQGSPYSQPSGATPEHPATAAAGAAAASPGTAAAGGSGAAATGPGRRGGAPPRQLNVEIVVAGGTLDHDGRPSSTVVRPLVLDSSPMAAAAVPAAGAGTGSVHPAAPRTPPISIGVGGPLLSPSGVSPRLMSPISLMPPSPAVGGGGVGGGGSGGTASSPPPQLQLPSRGSSARRSTPPLTSNRSTNSVMAAAAAAPLVAALSRPPSAPRAQGQAADSPVAQVMLSLPGQPDAPELQAMRTAPARGEHAGGELPAAAEAAAAGSGGAAGGDAAVAAAAAASSTAGGGVAASPYGPRTPARQPSPGFLHARRAPTSPSGAAASTSATVGVGSPVGGGGVGGGGGGSGTGMSAARPAPPPPPLLASASVGSILTLDSSMSGSSQRPPGLVRLRSNPLFEDVREAGTTAAAVSGGATTTAAALASAASGMPPLAEATSESDETTPTLSRGASSCVAVTPFAPATAGDIDGSGGTASGAAGGRPDTAAAAVAAAAAALTAVDDEELECGVCMEPLPMVAIAPCRHQICGPCARRICCLNIQKPSHCPFCRATISAFVAPAPLTSTIT